MTAKPMREQMPKPCSKWRTREAPDAAGGFVFTSSLDSVESLRFKGVAELSASVEPRFTMCEVMADVHTMTDPVANLI